MTSSSFAFVGGQHLAHVSAQEDARTVLTSTLAEPQGRAAT